MEKVTWVGALAVLTALGGAPVARATDLACVVQAKQDFQTCRVQCRDDFVQTRFGCRGVDAACGKACLAGREVCVDGVAQPLLDCVAGCRVTLQADKAACAPADTACVDAAQVKAFVCRDGCRDAWRQDPNTAAGLANCKKSFRACVGTCPPAQ